MARKAVAATLASVILLTVLVVADATVMSAQDNLASSAQTSQIEARESLLEESLAGAVTLQALAQVQGYLSSHPASCDDLPQYFGSILLSSNSSGDDSGIAYAASTTIAAAAPSFFQEARADNLTLLAPFTGEVPGALDLKAVVSVKEVGGGGSVTLQRNEAHTLNLPIEAQSASSLCASTLGAFGAALSQSPCNATLEQVAFDSVLPGVVQRAASLGFTLTAGWGQSGACSAAYWVTLVEPGVAGATGAFDWTVRGSGSTA